MMMRPNPACNSSSSCPLVGEIIFRTSCLLSGPPPPPVVVIIMADGRTNHHDAELKERRPFDWCSSGIR